MRQQARESATFAGQLVALAERSVEASFTTHEGAHITGRLEEVAGELARLQAPGVRVWIRIDSIASVAPIGAFTVAQVAADDRAVPEGQPLSGLLARLAEAQPEVWVRAAGRSWRGVLLGAGTDVLTVRGERGPVYLRTEMVTAVWIQESASG